MDRGPGRLAWDRPDPNPTTGRDEPGSRPPLWCGVLGPLHVRVDGTDVLGPGPRQRALVAALALRYAAGVPLSALSARVWSERHDVDRGAIRVLVHRLRQRLRTAGPDADAGLRRTADGYRWDLGPGSSDLADLRQLRDQARRAEASGDLALAVDLLDRASALVRGAPCQGVWSDPDRWPELVAVGEEVRELRRMSFDARLRLGDHRTVLPDLAALAAQEPTAEWVHDLHLRALSLAGRYDEAVTAHRAFRRRLRDDLGVEPSTALVRTYRRILDHDEPLPGSSPSAREVIRAGADDRSPTPGSRAALRALTEAGAYIADRGDYRRAAHCLTATLRLGGDPAARAEALLRLGEVRYHQAGAGLDELARAATLFRRENRRHQAAEALSWQARVLWLRPGDDDSALRRVAEAVDLIDDRAPDPAGAAALVNICGILAVSDRGRAARRAGLLGLAWARQMSLTPLDLRARANLALVDLTAGDADVVAELAHLTQAYRDRLGWVPPTLWVALADAEDRRARLGPAATYRELAVGSIRGQEATADVPWLVAERVREAFQRGRWTAARGAGVRYLRGEHRHHRMASEVHVVLSRLALHQGDLPAADRHSGAAERLARRDGGATLLGPALVQRLRVRIALGRPRARITATAEELLDRVHGAALTSSFGVDLPLALREAGLDVRALARHAPVESPWRQAAEAVLAGDMARARRTYLAVGSRGDARQVTAAGG
ncbi:AfsR/SARP family transcriptional regulator [Micromonospora sp. NPDC049240]|uniref:AfsR/SARP family transcriptional regulator n=1 Tax=Micromonospora sp. NPDC049240 TaxID=3155151 RepID=UPI0033FD4486